MDGVSLCWFTSGLRTCAHMGIHMTVTIAAGIDYHLYMLQRHISMHMHTLIYVQMCRHVKCDYHCRCIILAIRVYDVLKTMGSIPFMSYGINLIVIF